MSKQICILGATGTIGVNTLDVIRRHPDRYTVSVLTGYQNLTLLAAQCKEFRPRYVVVPDVSSAKVLQDTLTSASVPTEIMIGAEALSDMARLPDIDIVMAAIVGAAGLLPTLAAAEAGKTVLLANKEALVMSGPLFTRAVAENGAQLVPIDSEHNAVFQCLPENISAGRAPTGVKKIILTASGGPFRDCEWSALQHVTPAQACNHPNWKMGRKISVDSATMMNKGLELLEACWLFGLTPETVSVLVHPQSVVHSLVEYKDGSMLAQLGQPDMRTPIAHALAWPERIESGVESLDLTALSGLDFFAPDKQRFPSLRLAEEAWYAGAGASVVLNAANELAVNAFLSLEVPFLAISSVVADTLNRLDSPTVNTIDDILEVDQQARRVAQDTLFRYAA